MLNRLSRKVSRDEKKHLQIVKCWISQVMRKPLNCTSVYITQQTAVNASGELEESSRIYILDKDLPSPITVLCIPKSITGIEQEDIWRQEKRICPYTSRQAQK